MSAPRSSSPTSSPPPTESTPANEPAAASKTSLAYILTDENAYDEDVKQQGDEALDGNHLHNDHQHLYENYAYVYGAHPNSEYDSRGHDRQGRQYAFAAPLTAQRVPRSSFPLEQPPMPAYAQIASESWRGGEDAPPRKGSKFCMVPGCTSRAKHARLCWKHGGSVKCKVLTCSNRAKSKGVCWSHGGGTICSFEDCSTTSVSNGVCWAHGGGKRCVVEGCERPSYERTGKLCSVHFANFVE